MGCLSQKPSSWEKLLGPIYTPMLKLSKQAGEIELGTIEVLLILLKMVDRYTLLK
jgi:hypothetical protein